MKRLTFAVLGAVVAIGIVPGVRAQGAMGARAVASMESACVWNGSGALQEQQAAKAAQDGALEARDVQDEARERARNAEDSARDAREAARDRYEAALDAVNDSQWEKARESFDEIARAADKNADAALYWRAYCEDKLGRRQDALGSITALEQKYPQSRWQNDAKALELQVRHESGQPVSPESQSDQDLKLLAINSLMQSDPSHALPLLEKVLNGTGSPKLKERALFVLAQSGAPEASQILLRIAEGNSNPELQTKAVKYLGLFRGSRGVDELSQIYTSSTDEEVKSAVLRSFMLAGARDRLLSAAQSEKNPDLQREAIQMLGVSGARDDLWKLYQSTPPAESRRAILQAMFVAGDADHLEQLARSEKDEDLRVAAIRDMGLIGKDRTGSTLISMYAGAKDRATSKAVLQALFLQGNAQAIVDIARKETDPEMKKDAVQKLSLMHSKVATDYMMELLR
ncbi:MAG: HEAT repeat domain-containing protein [Candidatus Acidiferrales bacterium]